MITMMKTLKKMYKIIKILIWIFLYEIIEPFFTLDV